MACAASREGATFCKLLAESKLRMVSMPVGQLASYSLDRELDEGRCLRGACEGVRCGVPGGAGPEDHLGIVTPRCQGIDDEVGDVVAVGRADDDDVDVVGERSVGAVVACRPGSTSTKSWIKTSRRVLNHRERRRPCVDVDRTGEVTLIESDPRRGEQVDGRRRWR